MSVKFRLVPLSELVDVNPALLPVIKAMNSVHKHLRPGACVKIQVEAVGGQHKAAEELWVILERIIRGEYRGIVNTYAERSKYHGLKINSPIKFRKEHIIDVLTQGSVGAFQK